MSETKPKDGGPAFPGEHHDEELKQALLAKKQLSVFDVQNLANTRKHAGMSLRDWYAGQALQGLAHIYDQVEGGHEALANVAYSVADAMLQRRLNCGDDLG